MKRRWFKSLAAPIIAVGLLGLVLLFARHPAAASPATPQAITPIYDIQYTTDPGSDGTYPSPLVGQTVTTTGIVYAVYGYGFCIADASGPWHGLYVYVGTGSKPNVGDEVQVTGEVREYFGLTELSNSPTYVVLSSGNTPYSPTVVEASEIPYDNPDVSEGYESVFVEVRDIEVTEEADSHGVWTFTDASGGVGKADDWGYHAEPSVGDRYAALRGALIYTWNEYRVMPRSADDLVPQPYLRATKAGPIRVDPGALFTYTLTVENHTAVTLTQVVLTDRIPITHAVFATATDGGVLNGDVVSWTFSSLSADNVITVYLAMTATGSTGDEIWNRSWAAWASNWPTPTVGGPLLTVIGDYLPTYRIQGDDVRSPYEGQRVRTAGVVIGFFEGNYPGGGSFDGFFIQDPAGDGITTTSDGLFVNYGSLPISVNVGDQVVVTGTVQEFLEWDGAACVGDGCLTQIAVDSVDDVAIVGTGTVSPTLLDPPGDPDDAAIYWESLEGMWVTLPVTGVVVGPTSYGTVMVVPGDEGITRVMRGGPYQGMPVGVRHWERFGDIGGADPPNLIVGSVITDVDGPLMFSYGAYLVTTQAGDPWQVVSAAPEPTTPPTWPPAAGNEFTVMTFNVENFFDTTDDPGKNDPLPSATEYQVHRDKIVSTVVQAGCPTIIGLQEVEKLAVLQDVANVLATHGCTYTAVLSEGLDGRGIDVGFLVDTDRVTIEGVRQIQDCTTYDTGLGQGTCPAGQQYLFSRLPLVLTATVDLDHGQARVVVIANHLKSKRSREGDPESAQWRLLQAQSLAAEVQRIRSAEPARLLVVLGDLNDFEDSPPLAALYATGGLTNTWYTLPPEARYSYIYRGVSQILDHILIPPSGLSSLEAVGPLHYNADFPYKPYHDDDTVVWRTSDHDPVVATFRWRAVYLPLVLRAAAP